MSRDRFHRMFIGAASTVLLVTSTVGSDPTRASDLLTACEAEIGSLCAGVKEGRGRISACLYANDDKLSAACKTEVDAVADSPTFQRNFPSGTGAVDGSDTALREACTTDADKVCTGTRSGGGRMLACVYARADTVSAPCREKAEEILN